MRSYLSRFEDLRQKFLTYGVVPTKNKFVPQCLTNLSIFWREGMGELGRRRYADIPWHLMCESLLEQDNRRRVSNVHGEGLLPLGWSKKGEGEGRTAKGQTDQPPHSHDGAGAANAASQHPHPKGKGKGPARSSSPPKGKGEERDTSWMVCFYCLKQGHGSKDCKSKPEGWKPTPEQVQKAKAKRRELNSAKGNKAQGASSNEAGPSNAAPK